MPAKKPYRKQDKWANEKELAVGIGSGINDVFGRGTLAGLLGAPGDIAGMAENGIRALIGLPQVRPWGGSEHIGQKMQDYGLVSSVRRPRTELLASLISPAQVATASLKAPQYAKTALRLLDNLDSAPTMARIGQRGAVDTGLLGKMIAPQDEALRIAQQNAAKPVSEGGLGLRPDNTPEERAAAMGFEGGWAHGSPSPSVTEFTSSRIGAEGPGIYATNYLPEAGTYAGANDGATSYPIMVRRDSALDAGATNPYELMGAETDGDLLSSLIASGNDGIVATQSKTPDWLLKHGALDMPERQHYVSTLPSNFRSRFAAFDPMRKDSGDLLAGLSPLLLARPQEKEKPKKQKQPAKR